MTDSYATARAAYRELRSAIGPWAKANDYRRWAGTQGGGRSPSTPSNSYCPSSKATYHGLVQLEPLGSHGSTILRQSDNGALFMVVRNVRRPGADPFGGQHAVISAPRGLPRR